MLASPTYLKVGDKNLLVRLIAREFSQTTTAILRIDFRHR